MTLRNFRVFVEVCKQGTMSAAAEKLFISQSAISQIIKEMENHYDTSLFHRVSHKLYLTEAGQRLYDHALHMILYNEMIETSMANDAWKYHLRLGTINSFIIIDLIREYRNFNPNVNMTIIHNTRDHLDRLLHSSQIDIALVSGLFNLNNYDFFPLTDIPMVFACSKETTLSPLLLPEEPHITIEQLSQFPLYLWDVSEDLTYALNNVFSSRGLHYNIAGQFLHFDAVDRAVSSDFGIGLFNIPNFNKGSKRIKRVYVEGVELQSSLSFACHKQNVQNPLISNFIHFSQEHFDAIQHTSAIRNYSDI